MFCVGDKDMLHAHVYFISIPLGCDVLRIVCQYPPLYIFLSFEYVLAARNVSGSPPSSLRELYEASPGDCQSDMRFPSSDVPSYPMVVCLFFLSL